MSARRFIVPACLSAFAVLSLSMVLSAPGGHTGSGPLNAASPTASVAIPFDEWSGNGQFVYERWPGNGADPPASQPAQFQSAHRTYGTTLSIKPGRLQDHDVILIEIRSARGTLPGMEGLGDETHIRAALKEAKRISETTTLYRLVAFQINPKPQDDLKFEEQAPPFSASCTTTNRQTVLQIAYGENFVDTFRFQADRVEKSGMYFTNEGLIHWTENLRQAPQVRDNSRIAERPALYSPGSTTAF